MLHARTRSIRPLIVLTVLLASALFSSPLLGDEDSGKPAPIRVENHQNGEELRYPVPLLRGTLSDHGAKTIVVINETAQPPFPPMRGLARDGRFKILARLMPGKNRLLLRAGKHETTLDLTYRPSTNDHVVRAVYLTDVTGDTRYQTPIENDAQDYAAKLSTAMILMQTFTAERMHDLGYGRLTFDLEWNGKGGVDVHILKAPDPEKSFRDFDGHRLYGYVAHLLNKDLPHPKAKNLVLPAFTRFDPETKRTYAHTALGGGNLALFGGMNLFAWPDTLEDAQRAFLDTRRVDTTQYCSDSVGRHTFWAVASTTMGACLHELGHTFGLPHSTHPHDIMTRGFDRFNRAFTLVEPPHAYQKDEVMVKDAETACWAPVSAEILAATRWFAPDGKEWEDGSRTAFELDEKKGRIRIASPRGIAAIALARTDAEIPYPVDGKPKRVDVTLDWIRERLAEGEIRFHVVDGEGNHAHQALKDLAGK